MSGIKGMKKYPDNIRNEVIKKFNKGQSVWSLHKEYGQTHQ